MEPHREESQFIKLLKGLDEGLLGLAEMGLTILAFCLLFILPFTVLTLLIASSITYDWSEALNHLGIGILSVYFGRAILKYLRKND